MYSPEAPNSSDAVVAGLRRRGLRRRGGDAADALEGGSSFFAQLPYVFAFCVVLDDPAVAWVGDPDVAARVDRHHVGCAELDFAFVVGEAVA